MDPTLKNKTITALKASIPDLSPRLRQVAKYIIDHPSDFGLDPIRETARKCGVSTYTLVRMAEKMGFSGYDELRDPFRNALVSTTECMARPDWMDDMRDEGELGIVLAEASLNAMAIVQRTLERQSPAQMKRVAAMLLGAGTVYLTAVRASYAVASYLNYVGRMALPTLQLVPQQMNTAIDELHNAREGDVLIAITFAPYSRETVEACRYAHAKGVRLILISDSDVVIPDLKPEETLVVTTVSTHHFGCYSGAMAICENLLALLVSLGGDAARERITSYENLRDRTNAYWVAPKKH